MCCCSYYSPNINTRKQFRFLQFRIPSDRTTIRCYKFDFDYFIEFSLIEMSALNIDNLLVEQKPLHVPALNEIAESKHATIDLQAENFPVK